MTMGSYGQAFAPLRSTQRPALAAKEHAPGGVQNDGDTLAALEAMYDSATQVSPVAHIFAGTRATQRASLVWQPHTTGGVQANDVTADASNLYYGVFPALNLPLRTFYVRLWGNDANNGDTNTPWLTIKRANDLAAGGTVQPGDTVLIGNGVWNGANGGWGGNSATVFSGIHGLPGKPITIAAENDGGAVLDGGYVGNALFIQDSTYVTLRGFAVMHGGATSPGTGTSTVYLYGGNLGGLDHITLQRVTAHDTLDDNLNSTNSHVFAVYGNASGAPAGARATNILFEDCAGWGSGRYIINIYNADRTTIRRFWGSWRGWHGLIGGAPRGTLSNYGSTNTIFENCIATGCWPSFQDTNDYYAGCYDTNDTRTADNAWYLGCIFYNNQNGIIFNNTITPARRVVQQCVIYNIVPIPAGQTYTTNRGPWGIDSDINAGYGNACVEHTTIVNVQTGDGAFQTRNGTGVMLAHSSIVTNSTAVIDNTGHILEHHNDYFNNGALNFTPVGSDFTVDPQFNTAVFGNGAYLMGPTALALQTAAADGGMMGAQVLMRYQDGNPTNVPLWPWPMEARIVAEQGTSPTFDIWNGPGGLTNVTPPAAPPSAHGQWPNSPQRTTQRTALLSSGSTP
jgi:hypothetical protein